MLLLQSAHKDIIAQQDPVFLQIVLQVLIHLHLVTLSQQTALIAHLENIVKILDLTLQQDHALSAIIALEQIKFKDLFPKHALKDTAAQHKAPQQQNVSLLIKTEHCKEFV